jgi:hypothetical protein
VRLWSLTAAPVCCFAGRSRWSQWAAYGLRRSFRPGWRSRAPCPSYSQIVFDVSMVKKFVGIFAAAARKRETSLTSSGLAPSAMASLSA